MVKRREWTPEQKAEVVAYVAEHGRKAAMEHFKIASSMVARWSQQAAAGAGGRKRKWTPEKIAEVLEYLKAHNHRETLEHFKISGAQIYLWKHGLPNSHWQRNKAKPKANGANGLGVLDLPEKDALMWLERWREAYMRQLKQETPLAVDLLRALRSKSVE